MVEEQEQARAASLTTTSLVQTEYCLVSGQLTVVAAEAVALVLAGLTAQQEGMEGSPMALEALLARTPRTRQSLRVHLLEV